MRQLHRDLIVFLNQKQTWTTSKSLASSFDVSVRTIKSMIKTINTYYPELIQSSNDGYRLIETTRLHEALQNNSSAPQTQDERRKQIFKTLLLAKEEVCLVTLADQLAISPSTLTNEINKLKLDLAEYELHFSIKKDSISIEGYEKNKKKMFSKFIYEETKERFLSLESMRVYLPHFDLYQLRTIIVDTLDQFHYFVDEFSILNFVLHVAIILERPEDIKRDFYQEHYPMFPPHIQDIIEAVSSQIAKQFGCTLSEVECADLSLLLMTRIIKAETFQHDSNLLNDVIPNHVKSLVQTIQSRTLAAYNIDMSNEAFTFRFSLHIKNLLTRLENHVLLRNPQMSSIKNMYPFIYDISVFISNIIMSATQSVISEDEMAYIALHVGVLIEEIQQKQQKVRAILINPTYFSQEDRFARRIQEAFPQTIIITEVVPSFEAITSHHNDDLILSTIPVHQLCETKIVLISPFLSQQDISAIALEIDVLFKKRLTHKIHSKLNALFHEELFFISPQASQEDMIETLGDALIKYDYVDDNFKQKIYERESLSPSAYADIAMPHPIEMCAKHSAIAISIHADGLLWNQSKVKIVFMLAIHKEDHLLFRDIFSFITDVIVHSEQLDKLSQAQDYHHFIQTLLSFV